MRSTWKSWTSKALVACAIAWAAVAVVIAQPAEPRAVARAWAIFDGGNLRLAETLPRGDGWVAAVRAGPGRPLDTTGASWAELTDGQRIPGRLDRADERGLVWRSPRLGAFVLEWKSVASLRLSAPAPEAPGVRLTNDDGARGTMTFDGDGVTIEGEAVRLSAPWERVASVRLREPSTETQDTIVWLRNGGVIAAQRVRENADGAGVFVELKGGRAGQFERDEVLALTRGGRIESLGAPLRSDGLEPRGEGWLARAPATGSWALGEGAIGVVGIAQAPADSRRWSSSFVSSWADRELLWSVRTSEDQPVLPLAARVKRGLGERELRVSVQPGAAGRAGGVVELWLVVVIAP